MGDYLCQIDNYLLFHLVLICLAICPHIVSWILNALEYNGNW